MCLSLSSCPAVLPDLPCLCVSSFCLCTCILGLLRLWMYVCLSACCLVLQCNLGCICTIDHMLFEMCPPCTANLVKPGESCAADLRASAEPYVCLQALFGFFSKLNSYWVAPMVNVVFIVAAILTQLFLATLWGKAVLAWLTPKHAFMKVVSSPEPDPSPLHRSKPFQADTEQQRLLASAHCNSMHSAGASQGHNATQLEVLYEGPTGLCVEMAQRDGQ